MCISETQLLPVSTPASPAAKRLDSVALRAAAAEARRSAASYEAGAGSTSRRGRQSRESGILDAAAAPEQRQQRVHPSSSGIDGSNATQSQVTAVPVSHFLILGSAAAQTQHSSVATALPSNSSASIERPLVPRLPLLKLVAPFPPEEICEAAQHAAESGGPEVSSNRCPQWLLI